jgi:hypothetical protein
MEEMKHNLILLLGFLLLIAFQLIDFLIFYTIIQFVRIKKKSLSYKSFISILRISMLITCFIITLLFLLLFSIIK